jgi:hypothetical protein
VEYDDGVRAGDWFEPSDRANTLRKPPVTGDEESPESCRWP